MSGSSPPPKANTNDESFGTKKARSSFGRGFFKLRGGKQAASAPNLGTNELLNALLIHLRHFYFAAPVTEMREYFSGEPSVGVTVIFFEADLI